MRGIAFRGSIEQVQQTIDAYIVILGKDITIIEMVRIMGELCIERSASA